MQQFDQLSSILKQMEWLQTTIFDKQAQNESELYELRGKEQQLEASHMAA